MRRHRKLQRKWKVSRQRNESKLVPEFHGEHPEDSGFSGMIFCIGKKLLRKETCYRAVSGSQSFTGHISIAFTVAGSFEKFLGFLALLIGNDAERNADTGRI